MNDELPTNRMDYKEGVAPHTMKQALIRGKDQFFLLMLQNRIHDFVLKGIPEEVLEGQKYLTHENFEFTLYPADEFGLKRGKHIQKKRFTRQEEAESYFESIAKSIEKGDLR